ncbi:DUF3761 domain-containing protein [Cryptosporangium sp. NPDC051539]|uniref:DUF3761 domain-containing protein n=1 Tax=Cryptosporangium sp. NPDC051539 TaxID=3363962 RepID=UPI0037A76241
MQPAHRRLPAKLKPWQLPFVILSGFVAMLVPCCTGGLVLNAAGVGDNATVTTTTTPGTPAATSSAAATRATTNKLTDSAAPLLRAPIAGPPASPDTSPTPSHAAPSRATPRTAAPSTTGPRTTGPRTTGPRTSAPHTGGNGSCADEYYRNVDGDCVHRPTKAPQAPAGATALCEDGSWSYSRHRQGTCSHHGGVERWL